MNPYVLLPLTACVFTAMLAVAILTRDVRHPANRIGAVLVLGASAWAFCEVLWNTASDAERVLSLVRLSSAGWVALGPLGLHLFVVLTGSQQRVSRRLLAALYAASAGFLALDLTTPWIHPGVFRTSWGWAYELGPAYPFFYLFTVGCLLSGIALGVRDLRNSSPGERSQSHWLIAGVVVPLVVASLTDGILPWLGVQLPRLGTVSFTVLGATIAWGFSRHGYSVLAPGFFASEILATLPDGVALLRLDGRIRTANRGLGALVGVSPGALLGRSVGELIPDASVDLAAEGGEQECTLESPKHGPVPVAISTALLRDKRGLPLGRVLVVRDLREVASLRSHLVTSGRLAAVGELAAGIAHEINNPIAFVRANLGGLHDLLGAAASKLGERERGVGADLAEGQELVQESLEGVDRVAAIVRDVKGFSHAGGGPRQAIDLHELLESVLRVAAPQLRYAGRVERRYDPVPRALGSPQELKQVFLNLVINASQALREDGSIRIATEAAGERVVVRVEDDGCGIPPDVISRIFDPFFTTKPVGEGTGLGLAISHQIVRKHGGELSVDSTPGAGTCVRVALPAV